MTDEHKKLRDAEKVDEFLFNAWVSLEKNNADRALSLYHAVLTVYGGGYDPIKSDLKQARERGFLPQNFVIPEKQEDFIKFVEGTVLKKKKY